MNKDEMKMIEEMAEIIYNRQSHCLVCSCEDCGYSGRINCNSIKKAVALYNANCRIIGEDEIVVKKSDLEGFEKLARKYESLKAAQKINDEHLHIRIKKQAKQETARAILQMIYDKGKDTAMICLPTIAIKQLAKAYGIKLED